MIKKFTFLSIFFIINSLTLFSQEKTGDKSIDSLLNLLPNIKVDTSRINTLNLIAVKFNNLNPNKGIIYGNKALILSKKIKWNDGIAWSLLNIGINNSTLGNVKEGYLIYEKALSFTKNKRCIASLYISKGFLEVRKSNYTKALDLFFKSLKISEEINDISGMARSYYIIGTTYNELKDNKKALSYNKRALVLNTNLKMKSEMCDNLMLMGDIYRDNKKYTTALEYFFKSFRLVSTINNKFIIANVNLKIEQIYQFQDKYELALKHIFIGKNTAQEISSQRLISAFKVDEGLIYLLQFEKDSSNPQKQFLLTKAEFLLLDALKDYRKSNDNYNISVCYDTLTYLYQLQNKDKEATLMALKYAGIKDSIFSDQSKETIKNLEDQRTIDLKDKEIEINKITLENKEKQKWFYITGIGFLGILGGLLFFQSRKRKKNNEKLQFLNSALDQANKTKIKFLSILNHDLRSPVYNFIHFMQLQKESPELLDAETKKRIETRTISSAENLLGSMEDLLLWSKGQMDNFQPQLKNCSINTLFDDTQKHFESEEKVDIVYEKTANLYINTDENFFKTIIRNLTGNAIKVLKYKDNAKIIWKAWTENDITYLSITDNGPGDNLDKFKALYDENEVVGIKTGLGLHLIRDLAKAINCTINVESNLSIGTTFILKIEGNEVKNS